MTCKCHCIQVNTLTLSRMSSVSSVKDATLSKTSASKFTLLAPATRDHHHLWNRLYCCYCFNHNCCHFYQHTTTFTTITWVTVTSITPTITAITTLQMSLSPPSVPLPQLPPPPLLLFGSLSLLALHDLYFGGSLRQLKGKKICITFTFLGVWFLVL